MAVEIKICGINAADAARAAADADYAGFVFYAPSPRHVTPGQAKALAAELPARVKKVGLFVDAEDAAIEEVLRTLRLDMLQLHGDETPERAAAIKARFGVPVMKAVKLSAAASPPGSSTT